MLFDSNTRKIIIIMALVIVSTELLSVTGAITPPHLVMYMFLAKGAFLFVAPCFFCSFIVFIWSPLNRSKIISILCLGLLLCLIHNQTIKQLNIFVYILNIAFWLGVASIIFGIGGFIYHMVVTCCNVNYDKLRQLLIVQIILPLCFITGICYLLLGNYFHQKTYDYLLFAFDQCLGVDISFLFGSIINKSPLLMFLCSFSYILLPVTIAFVAVLQMNDDNRMLVAIIRSCILAGVLGIIFYLVYPASGPIYRFGKAFPNHPPTLSLISLRPAILINTPRNAMPSLHITWALLGYIYSRRFALWPQIITGSFLVLTFISTLALGEHYAIDLIVAVPFTIAVRAIIESSLPILSPERYRPIVLGIGLTITWLVFLRYFVNVFILSSLLAWVAVIITILASILLEWGMENKLR